MELCRELGIMKYHAVKIIGLGLSGYGKTAAEVEDKVTPLIEDVVDDGAVKYHIIYSPKGEVTDQLLLEFSNNNSQDAFEAQIVQGMMNLGAKNCKVESVYQDKAAAAPMEGKHEMQLICQLKPFSGLDKPGPGECNVTDWIAAARQLMEPYVPLTDAGRLRFMKNSLTKNALTLVLSGEI